MQRPDQMKRRPPRAAGTLYASEGRQRMCSPGERGWVIAGETWPGQLLSFLRDPVKPSRWRDVKARAPGPARPPPPAESARAWTASHSRLDSPPLGVHAQTVAPGRHRSPLSLGRSALARSPPGCWAAGRPVKRARGRRRAPAAR